jgi:threonine/homoserine/homoserine lactone efflux protein
VNPGSLIAFGGLCLLLALTPGPDVLLSIRYGARRRRDGLAVALGSAAGSIGWAVLVAVGLAAVIEQSAEAYRVVRFAGGCYLLYLGVTQLMASRRRPVQPQPVRSDRERRRAGPFLAGLGSCLLNPKVGLFFLAVVPQFLPAGAIDAAVALAYLSGVVLITAKVVGVLARPPALHRIERVCGAVLAALGIGTAAQAVAARS